MALLHLGKISAYHMPHDLITIMGGFNILHCISCFVISENKLCVKVYDSGCIIEVSEHEKYMLSLVHRGSTATISPWHFVCWIQCPRFMGDRHFVRRSCSPQIDDDGLHLFHIDATKGATSTVLPCQFDSSPCSWSPTIWLRSTITSTIA